MIHSENSRCGDRTESNLTIRQLELAAAVGALRLVLRFSCKQL